MKCIQLRWSTHEIEKGRVLTPRAKDIIDNFSSATTKSGIHDHNLADRIHGKWHTLTCSIFYRDRTFTLSKNKFALVLSVPSQTGYFNAATDICRLFVLQQYIITIVHVVVICSSPMNYCRSRSIGHAFTTDSYHYCTTEAMATAAFSVPSLCTKLRKPIVGLRTPPLATCYSARSQE